MQKEIFNKGSYEKTMYKNRFTSKVSLGKTEKDPINVGKTNESSFEEEKPKSVKIRGRRKSTKLRAKKFLSDNLVAGILSGIIILLISGYTTLSIRQGIQGGAIQNIKDDIGDINKKNERSMDNYGSLKGDFDVFKAEILKDLEYIKQQQLFSK